MARLISTAIQNVLLPERDGALPWFQDPPDGYAKTGRKFLLKFPLQFCATPLGGARTRVRSSGSTWYFMNFGNPRMAICGQACIEPDFKMLPTE